MNKKLTVVDLFSGAGGLSLGFRQTNKFDIKVAYENNPSMQETYRYNHPGVDVRGDVCSANYAEIEAQYGHIDVVIGGPPCQGFSNANRQKNHAISKNNMLVKQYIRAIQELQPKAFVMENVSMLCSEVHRFYLDNHDLQFIKQYDIPMASTKLVLLDKDYLFDGASLIVRDANKVAHYLWPEEEYIALNVVYKNVKNKTKFINSLAKHKKELMKIIDRHLCYDAKDYVYKQDSKAFEALREYYQGTYPVDKLQDVIEPVIMIQRMLSKAQEIFDNNLVVEKYVDNGDLCAVIKSYAVFDYLKAILGGEPNNYVISAGVLCAADYGAPQKRNRFVVMGIKKSLTETVSLPKAIFLESQYRTVRDAISDLETETPVMDVVEDKGIQLAPMENLGALGEMLRDSTSLRNHIITNTRETAMERFKALKQGQNFHSLDESLKTNTYTDVSRTQNTIYLRLNYDQPSGTVVNVRKSMWIHPVLNRAVSVREAARLQTFPDSFVFCGTKDKQYQQVGNAVPPIMARAIAEELAFQLENNECLG